MILLLVWGFFEPVKRNIVFDAEFCPSAALVVFRRLGEHLSVTFAPAVSPVLLHKLVATDREVCLERLLDDDICDFVI